MAERRMFSKTIIDSDAFLDMPLSSQSLYFHLSMRADDEGFVNNPKKIQRVIGCSEDDLKLLIAKKFILAFDNGVIVIKHWKIHNYIQKDRYKPTVYQEEKQQLHMKENKSYTLDTKCIQDVSKMDTQVSIGKDSIGKDNNMSGKPDEQIPYKKIIDYLNEQAGKKFKVTEKWKTLIRARWNEGQTYDDFIKVIDTKTKQWLNDKTMNKYLRPATLFGNKFDDYLNEYQAPVESTTDDSVFAEQYRKMAEIYGQQ